jgi:hypothetical protein
MSFALAFGTMACRACAQIVGFFLTQPGIKRVHVAVQELADQSCDHDHEDSMNQIPFRVTTLSARVPDGIPIQWQGRELMSGPLEIRLNTDAVEGSKGLLDYEKNQAKVTLRVNVSFPELAAVLNDLGVDAKLTKPIHARLRSTGEIRDDHSLVLGGECALEPHELFPSPETAAALLPGH